MANAFATSKSPQMGERNVMPSWSADGGSLYFYQVRPTPSFKRIPATGGMASEIARGWRWRSHNAARVDSDGKRIVYSKLQRGNAVATLVRDMETGTETIFRTTLDSPRWSSDDSRISFDRSKSTNSREVWAVSPEGKDERRIIERGQVDPIATFYDISRTGQVVYVQFKQGQQELWMTDFH